MDSVNAINKLLFITNTNKKFKKQQYINKIYYIIIVKKA